MLKPFPATRILLKRLLIALILAFACRVIFLVFNPSFLAYDVPALTEAFLYGFLYDVSAIVYLNSLFILLHFLPLTLQVKKWYQALLLVLFVLANGPSLVFNLIDTAYYRFGGRRSGIELFAMRNELDGLKTAYLVDFWYLWLLLLVLLCLLLKFYMKTLTAARHMDKTALQPSWLQYGALWLTSAALLFAGARGSLGLLPLNTFDAARQTRAELVPLVVNTPFNMIMSTQQSGLKPVRFFDQVVAKHLFNPVQILKPGADSLHGNIILIIVESLGKEYIGYYNKGRGYTPFIDSLLTVSSFKSMHVYANGKRSVEGIPSILASMPSWMNTPYLSSYYQGNHIKSAGAYLKEMGYNTSFYHGGRNGTMSFDNFIAISNGGDYYGMSEYNNEADYDGSWGIYDEPYLRYFAKELTKKPMPFFSTVFTLSSHHPYKLPEKYSNRFAAGTLPVHKTIGYVDYALRCFFELAKQQPWYKNTRFIITADHSAENETPYYQSSTGKFEVPFFIFDPGHSADPGPATFTFSQLDILPVILYSAGYTGKPFYSFGTNNQALASTQHANGWAMQFQDNYYQLVQWPYVYQFDGMRELGFFNLATDSLMQSNLLNTKGYNKEKKLAMDSLLKSIVQTYNNDLINNKTKP